MDYVYPPPGSEFLLQDETAGPPPQLLTSGHPALERSPFASYAPWIPLSSHGQPGYLSDLGTEGYDNITAHSGNGLLASSTALSLNANDLVIQSHQLQISDGTDALDLQSRAPPPHPRKRKAPTLREDDWNPVKARILELHITQNLPLPEVKELVEREFESIGFSAT
jgi:hypothetical protein